MPSHSKKQHNFMEAIAHSPSFAKKAGVPQSVGKDYAAADKGKTFGKGGKMKDSKVMVGKEVAFMKKKGAPKSMIKHEMSEMKGIKKGGRVRRMAEGGETDMSMGYGDPFAKPRNYEEEKERGTKNLEGIKNFFGFGKKKDEAPIDRSRDKPEPVIRPSMGGPSASSATSRVSSQSPRTRRENEDTLSSDAAERDDAASMDKTAKGPQYTSNVNQGETDFGYESQRGTKTGSGASGFPSSYKDSGFSALGRASAKKRKPIGFEKVEKKERVITEPVSKTPFKSDSPDLEGREESMKPKRKFGMASDETRASVRKGLGSFLDFFDLSKAHEREFGKKMAKGGNVKRMRYGGSPEDGMDMGQPMRGAPMGSPQMPAAPRGRGRPMPEMGRRFGMGPDGMTRLAPRGRGMAQQTPSYDEPPMPIEPKAPPKEPPPRDIPMAVPRDPRMKAGGAVKKMAEGGYAKADGVASRGKTQPKMVKMASGGFVKSADGCAQRGKTKAFQVKMKRGGMC